MSYVIISSEGHSGERLELGIMSMTKLGVQDSAGKGNQLDSDRELSLITSGTLKFVMDIESCHDWKFSEQTRFIEVEREE